MKGGFLEKKPSLLSSHIFFQHCVNSIFHVGVGLLLTKLPAFEETGYGHLMLNYDHSILMAFCAVFLQMPAEYIYHSPMKLREGNVFRRVFPSVILSTGGSRYRAPAPSVQGLCPSPAPLPLRHTQTC